MSEILTMIGPDAIRNLLQNWPFAVVVVGYQWLLWNGLMDCHATMRDTMSRLIDHELEE